MRDGARRGRTQGSGARERGATAGQHSAEFALLLGLAGIVAVAMQPMMDRVLREGIQYVSDEVLGPETAEQRQEREDDEERTVEHRADADREQTTTGDADFRRRTRIQTTSTGRSVNTDCNLIVDGQRNSCTAD